MAYFDYSATTPVLEEVLDSYNKATLKYMGNPNSLHRLGVEANDMIKKCTHQIATIMGCKDSEIIYTSGSSESNNFAIKGIAFAYQNRGKHLITTRLEHSSVSEPMEFLHRCGYEVSYVDVQEDGKVDLEQLQKLMRDDTILVSIHGVNSELGIVQPVMQISQIVKQYPKCFFHVDMTQAVGKIPVSCDGIDLMTFAPHKFYGLKGIGVLIKKDKIELEPLIHGGKSTTSYRSGTPALPLIVSLAKSLRLAVTNLDERYQYVQEQNGLLREYMKKYPLVCINSPVDAIPHILNISVLGVKPETLLHALEEKDVYISTKSACSSSHAESAAVWEVTKDKKRSSSSVRISLSYMTKKEELEYLMKVFEECYQHLTLLERK